MKRVKRVAAVVGVLAAATVGAVQVASASSTSDRPASVLVWPKVVVDSSGIYYNIPVDTQITLSNANTAGLKQAHCFYVNATSHCSNNPSQACQTSAQCVVPGGTTGACVPGWSEMDFDVYLTVDQPLEWYASSGLRRGDFPVEGPFKCNAPFDNLECFTPNDARCLGAGCNSGMSNLGSGIPPAPEDPFIGSLTCIQYTGGSQSVPDQSATRNQLTGEGALLMGGAGIPLDVAKYNAVGLQATGTPVSNKSLNIGGGTANYNACPTTLILNHLFDGSTDPLGTSTNETSITELTLVPCSNDFSTQTPGQSTAQFLVFNEFEQRFSTSRTGQGQFNGPISVIDTRNQSRSIFSAGVAGTIAGQTRIRGVAGNTINGVTTNGGLLGMAQVWFANKPAGGTSSAAYNLHQQGNPSSGQDLIVIP